MFKRNRLSASIMLAIGSGMLATPAAQAQQ